MRKGEIWTQQEKLKDARDAVKRNPLSYVHQAVLAQALDAENTALRAQLTEAVQESDAATAALEECQERLFNETTDAGMQIHKLREKLQEATARADGLDEAVTAACADRDWFHKREQEATARADRLEDVLEDCACFVEHGDTVISEKLMMTKIRAALASKEDGNNG